MIAQTKKPLASVTTAIRYLFDYARPEKLDKARENAEKSLRALEEDDDLIKILPQDERDALYARYQELSERHERIRSRHTSHTDGGVSPGENEEDDLVSDTLSQELITSQTVSEVKETKDEELQASKGSAKDLLRRFSPNFQPETPLKDKCALLTRLINEGNLFLITALCTIKDNLEILDQLQLEHLNELFKRFIIHKKKIESKKTLEEVTIVDSRIFYSDAYRFLQRVQMMIDMSNALKEGDAAVESELEKILTALKSEGLGGEKHVKM